MEEDEFGGQSSGRLSGRRSARNATSRSNGTDTWSQWRGERRSSRLGAPPEVQLDQMQLDGERPTKRARTEESSASSDFGRSQSRGDSGSARGESSSTTANRPSAAAIKPGEIKLDKVQGKKGSKFWFYAVEPILGHAAAGEANGTAASAPEINGHAGNGHAGNEHASNGHESDGHPVPPDKDDSHENKTSPDSMIF